LAENQKLIITHVFILFKTDCEKPNGNPNRDRKWPDPIFAIIILAIDKPFGERPKSQSFGSNGHGAAVRAPCHG
jgi:hypothetical protein